MPLTVFCLSFLVRHVSLDACQEGRACQRASAEQVPAHRSLQILFYGLIGAGNPNECHR